jgi:hypothetical protein
MNTVKALYVYSPTTFHTDRQIEAMSGSPHPPGEVRLPPGIYRASGNANVVAKNEVPSSAYSIFTFDTKGGTPDPPQQAMQLNNASAEDIRNFFNSLGEADELPES